MEKSDTWKIQLAIVNDFISSKDNDEERVMHSKSDNIEIMIYDEADEVTKELFNSLENKHQNNSESMKGSAFVVNYIYSLYYKCHKINPSCGGSCKDSPDWTKNEKEKINSINEKDNNFSQYALIVVLSYGEI